MANPGLRADLIDVFSAAVAAVEPRRAVRRAVSIGDDRLRCGPLEFDLAGPGRLLVIAFGKAAPAMCSGLGDVVPVKRLDGIVVTNRAAAAPLPVIVGGHPLPDAGSVAGGEAVLELAETATADDLVVCLVSGGGSAIVEAPAGALDVADLIVTNQALLRSGADITEFNTVRKHLSRIKGGRLAAAASEARLLTLVLSDVVGDPLDVIASGPTVPDPTTYGEALAILHRRNVVDAIPSAVLRHLEAGRNDAVPETPALPHPRSHVAIVGNGRVAAESALVAANAKGWASRVVATDLTGEARVVAADLVTQGGPTCQIYAGETTVTVTGSGTGGRNQEAALAAAIALAGRTDVTFLAGGTDGIDGPTTAAGAVVDGTTASRGAAAGLDPMTLLEDNDAHRFLEATGDLLVTGPTGTNVGDLWLVHRAAS